jgi:hypothetical protein
MPIFMFDKDGAFVVMRLEQVSMPPPVETPIESITGTDRERSCYHYLLDPKLFPLRAHYRHETDIVREHFICIRLYLGAWNM